MPSLSAAGFAATTIAFGPARMGFGLFVPEFRSDFSMSAPTVGLVSSIGFSGFILGLVLAQDLQMRHGPGAPVLLGLLAATLGMGLVAAAPSLVVLALGVFIATTSAGFTWTPFNDAVHCGMSGADRPTALSTISTGTSFGIAAAGIAALVVSLSGLSWRACWAVFAGASGLTLVFTWRALRRVEGSQNTAGIAISRDAFLGTQALSLFVVAFVVGTTSAIYISFAADRMTRAGGVAGFAAGNTPALVFTVYGVFGLAGLFTGRLRRIVGFAPLMRAILLAGAASAACVALAPGSWTGLVLSAGLQGVCVMMASAAMAFWSERLYPALPSLGFTVTLLPMAAGTVVGPLAAGFASEAFGAGPMFLGSASLALAAALMLRRRHLCLDQASVTGGSEADDPG